MGRDIRLIGMDFDNTLYSGPETLARVLPWFEKLSAAGVKLGLVTGRTFDPLRRLFEADRYHWGRPFPDFAICYESRILDADGRTPPGCETWNRERDEDVRRAHDLLDGLRHVWLGELQKEGVDAHMVYCDPSYGLYLEFDTPDKSKLAADKLVSLADPEHRLRFVRNYCGVSIHARNRSKGPALASLLEAWEIPQEQALVIGDSLNDLCMMNGDFRYRAATVANADPVIRRAVEQRGGIIAQNACSLGVIEIFEQVFGRLP